MFKTTVDSILADFNKTIGKLDSLARNNIDAALTKKEKAGALVHEALVLDEEADRARKISAKLNDLIGS